MFVHVTTGARIWARLMKYLVESGMRPQSFTAMFAEPPDCDLRMKAELRKRGSAMIVGAFGVMNYNYFRTAPPQEDHLHIDPVSIYCAVVEKGRSFSGSLTLLNQGLEPPKMLMDITANGKRKP